MSLIYTFFGVTTSMLLMHENIKYIHSNSSYNGVEKDKLVKRLESTTG